MTEQRTIKLSFVVEKQEVLEDLFQTKELKPGAVLNSEGDVEIRFQSKTPMTGFFGQQLLVDVLVGFGVGVPASVAGSWIYERLVKHHGVSAVEVANLQTDTSSADSITKVIEENTSSNEETP